MAYRRFVFALPQRTACDITECTLTQRLEQNGPMKVMLAINISAMLNTGLTPEEVNLLPEPKTKSSTSQLFYATRNIKRGDEILTDLTFRDQRDFAATDLGMRGWLIVGIGRVRDIALTIYDHDSDLRRRVLEESDEAFESRELTALYEFVRGMPMEVMKSRSGLAVVAAYDEKIARIEEENKIALEQSNAIGRSRNV
eukprot:scaffold44329_cov146-Skeletonema_marinoi.AAC.1